MGIFWITLLGACLSGFVAVGQSDEKRLIKHIVDNYHAVGLEGRPVENSADVLDVEIGFSLYQIVNVDVASQILDCVGWVHLSWFDVLLKWEPDDWKNITELIMEPSMVWTPDIVLFNAVEAPARVHPDTKVLVQSTGQVYYVTANHYKATCPGDRDVENPSCHMTFGSWSYNTNHLSLTAKSDRIDASFYNQHHDWELLKTKAVAESKSYECCPGVQYGNVKYTFALKRRPPPDDDKDDDCESAVDRAHALPLLVAIVTYVALSFSGRTQTVV